MYTKKALQLEPNNLRTLRDFTTFAITIKIRTLQSHVYKTHLRLSSEAALRINWHPLLIQDGHLVRCSCNMPSYPERPLSCMPSDVVYIIKSGNMGEIGNMSKTRLDRDSVKRCTNTSILLLFM
jgi:hypothetical protein